MKRRITRRRAISFALVSIAILVLATLITLDAYYFNWSWTGFGPKTFWDWLQLLVIPIVLAVGGLWFSRQEQRYEQQLAENRRKDDLQLAENRRKDDLQLAENRRKDDLRIAENRSQDDTLQLYLDKMTELLLQEDLRASAKSDEVRSVARARTLTVLRRLGRERRRVVVRFLIESRLIETGNPIISFTGHTLNYDLFETDFEKFENGDLMGVDIRWHFLDKASLKGANIRAANLEGAFLRGANLHGADLRHAILQGAFLSGVDLEGANLQETNFQGADLQDANLKGANLKGANLKGANLKGANLYRAELQGADPSHAWLLLRDSRDNTSLNETRYNGKTKWPDGFEPQAAGAILDDT